jgi:hypothetical protein
MATTKLTAASVRAAVRSLRECIPRVPPGIVEVMGEESGRPSGTTERALQDELQAVVECALVPVPWFWCKEGKLDSPQLPFFGFYVLRSAIRGALLAANFYSSGRLLLASAHYGPAVALFYTASFHLCQAYLALHGRVFVSPVLTEPFVLVERDIKMLGHIDWPTPQMILCKLTRNNRWIIEGRTRSHVTVWREIGTALNEDEGDHVPIWLSDFLMHLRKDSPEEPADADTTELLCRLADLRHKALYEGIGIDESAMTPMGRERVIYADALAARANEFEKLTSQWLEYVLNDAVPTLLECSPDGLLHATLVSGVVSPALDPAALEWMQGCDGYEMFERLVSWMIGSRESVDSRGV